MGGTFQEVEKSDVTHSSIALTVIAAMFFTIVTLYFNFSFFNHTDKAVLSQFGVYTATLSSSIGLPLLLIITSQLLSNLRGLKNCFRALFWGSFLTFVATLPLIFAGLNQ